MKSERFCLLVLMCFIYSFTYSQDNRKRINFDNGWRFHFGHAADPEKDFNYSVANIFSKSGKAETTAIDTKFDDSKWQLLNLPHDWAVDLPFVESENFDVMAHGYKPVGGLFPETSIGWYRKNFTIASADSGKRFSIQFDGVFRNSKVWLNGFYLGTNESGYMGFTYDVTDYVDFKNENVLVVRVDATQYEGWFYEGAGIYRHVWLNQFNNIHIVENGVFTYTTVKDKSAMVHAETTVKNTCDKEVTSTLTTFVSDRNGKQVGTPEVTTITLGARQSKTFEQQVEIIVPKLWSLEEPYLYKIHSIIKINDQVVDRLKTRFGIRTIEIAKNNSLLLNGKPIKIQGVNCHQDHAGVGSALPDYLQYYRIRLLKEMGTNAYRASHNPPTPELLDACDSLGMLVMDETRLLNSSPEYMDQFARLIRRDRNHASVFMWSIGNEEGYVQRNSFGKRIALSMLALQRELDPTRTSTYAADLGNEFTGINEVIPVRGFNYREKFIVPYHGDHPDQPIVGTEMGSTVTTRGVYEVDSVRGYLPDQDIHAPWWASTAEAWWPIAADNPWMMGGFIWTGFDYRGEPTPFKWPNINSHFGVMDMCGFPKNIYYYYQSWWTNKDVLHITPHWNWKGKEGTPIEVWVNSNADQVELFLNGKSLGKKTMTRNSHLKWMVPYKAGTLEAVGFKNGRKFKTSIQTTGEPSEIMLIPDRKIVAADGKDGTVINVVVKDNKGREIPDASNLIKFSVSGEAKAIGVGNGDPSSHEPDRFPGGVSQRKLFNGKCQLILQAGNISQNVQVEASSEGLKSATLTIECKDPGEMKVSLR